MFSKIVIGNGVGFWKTMPTLARSRFTSCALSSTLRPLNRISPSARWPGYRSNIRLKVRSSVDLPQPDGPMKAVTL
jgi:hypothetical protein